MTATDDAELAHRQNAATSASNRSSKSLVRVGVHELSDLDSRPSTAKPPVSDRVDDRETTIEHLSKKKAIILITHGFMVFVVSSFTNALITLGIPAIVDDIGLDPALLYWPVLIYNLTCAAFLLLAGAVADVVGHRTVALISLLFLGIFVLTSGFARNGQELIAFRGISGVALAFYLPTSTSLVSTRVPKGKLRNLGFSLLGIGQVVGYAAGLVLSGVFVSTIGWRFGFYLCGGAFLLFAVVGIWALPLDRQKHTTFTSMWWELQTTVDWTGVVLASTTLGLLAYVLAQISVDASSIKNAPTIVELVIGLLMGLVCCLWFAYQEKNKKPTLIPNSLWKKLPFTAVCVMVMFAYAQMGSIELLASLFFQQIQKLSPIETSLRLLPSMIVSVLFGLVTGSIVHRVPAVWLVVCTSAFSAVAPILMAVNQPQWPYWYAAFPAQLLYPLCLEVLYTVALLIISEIFPDKDQALASAVFNVVGQFGQALGLAMISIVVNAVRRHEKTVGSDLLAYLLDGYRAGFWTIFAWMVTLCAVGAVGLRKIGKVGLKQ